MVRMDGSTPGPDRITVIDKFNRADPRKEDGIDAFLLTTGVGGVGITLTGADRVVIYDPSWNPATDAQAVDRAYRVGQTKDVVVCIYVESWAD
jgi:SNF2 family DNA or RNA helicase